MKAKVRKNPGRRRRIFATIVMAAGLLSLLSIASYSTQDEIVLDKLSILDIVRLPFNEHAKALASELQNRLGIAGAFLANFFINDTIGYASFLIPCLMIIWGWALFRRKRPLGREPLITNYAITLGLLFAAAAGTANLLFGNIDKEWSGVIGAFLADVGSRIAGTIGASILILTAFIITGIFAADMNFRRSLSRFSSAWSWIRHRRGAAPVPPEPEEAVLIRKPDEEVADVIPSLPELAPPDEEESPPDAVAAATPSPEEDEEISYELPSIDLLDPARQADAIPEEELKANAELVRAKLANFSVEIESVSVSPGPVVTLYELVPASSVKISRIVSLADDLALALAAKGIRIMAPIPGKSAVGVEIPNRNPSIVHIRSVLNSPRFRETSSTLPIALGKSISGDIYMDDLAKMPHLLIAGSTGSGKSIGINTILAGLLYRLHPSDVKFIIIDPKKIELAQYAKLKHHYLAISPDLDQEIITVPENAVSVLKSVELEMENRYDRLASAGVRNIQDYNERLASGRLKNSESVVHRKMPYLVVVIDELADLMMTAAREVEEPIARLAQLARAVGVHLVLATQRPSVDVITGVIKANFAARIAYQVATKTDSRTILDMNGAEQLLGAGDMLYLPAGTSKPIRIQNAFISTDEVERITDHVAGQPGYQRPFMLPSVVEQRHKGGAGAGDARDEFFEEAARIIVRHQQGSVSLLQRRLKVGYSRAARLVDELESAGIVGPFDGSKARLVLIENDEQLDRVLDTLG